MRTIFASIIVLALAAPAAFASDDDSRLCTKKPSNYRPTYCEKAPPKAPPKAVYKGGLKDSGPVSDYPSRKRYEDSPLYIIPSFFGAVLGTAGDLVEDVFTGTYKTVKGVPSAIGAGAHDVLDSVAPDK